MSERFTAWHFDGRTAQARVARLRIEGPVLAIESEGSDGARSVPLAEIRVSEPFDHAPRIVTTAAGETFEVGDGGGFGRALQAAGVAASAVVRLQRHGPAVACALALLVGAFAYAYLEGIPAAARWAAHETPRAVQERLGESLLALLDEGFLEPSALPDPVRESIGARFARAAGLAAPAHAVRLEFRRYVGDPQPAGPGTSEDELDEESGDAMVNALSLPGGIIVVLDGLVDAATPDEVFAVLGHELGHVTLEHSMQGFYQSAGVGALAGLAWGDFSGIAASVPTVLGLLRYDRALEEDADDFAVRFLTIESLDADALCGFFEIVLELEHEDGDDGFPEFLSSHPDTSERVARLCPERATSNRD